MSVSLASTCYSVDMGVKNRRWPTFVIFGIYVGLLTWLILFKFATSLDEIPQMRNLNLVPFSESMVVNGNISFDEIIYNLLVFIPFGMYMRIFLTRHHWIIQVLPALILSFTYEMLQYVFAIGGSDITDVITNTAGGLIGVGLCAALMKWKPASYGKILDWTGFALEVIFLALLGLLLIANA